MKKIYLILIYTLLFSKLSAQVWDVHYNLDLYSGAWQAIECYDKSILVSVITRPDEERKYEAHLVKIGHDAKIKWKKTIGFRNQRVSLHEIVSDASGNIYMTGEIVDSVLNKFCALVIKLNPCGEKDWVKYFELRRGFAGDQLQAWHIKLMKNGDILVPFYSSEQVRNDFHTVLTRINKDGNVVWQSKGGADPADIFFDKDQNIYMASSNYFTCYDDTSLICLKGTVNKWTPDGNAIYYNCFRLSSSFPSMFNAVWQGSNNAIILGADRSGHGIKGAVASKVVLDKSGYFDDKSYQLYADTNKGNAYTVLANYQKFPIGFLKYSRYENFEYFYQTSIFKMDTDGNIIKTITLGNLDNRNPGYYHYAISSTPDDKFLVAGSYIVNDKYYMHIYKFDTNLVLDTIRSLPRNYDTLCNHPFDTSRLTLEGDTIFFNSDTIPNSDDARIFWYDFLTSEESPAVSEGFSFYPNPTSNELNIEFPESYIDKKLIVTVINNLGQTIYSSWNFEGNKLKLDTSNWSQGAYHVFIKNRATAADEAHQTIIKN